MTRSKPRPAGSRIASIPTSSRDSFSSENRRRCLGTSVMPAAHPLPMPAAVTCRSTRRSSQGRYHGRRLRYGSRMCWKHVDGGCARRSAILRLGAQPRSGAVIKSCWCMRLACYKAFNGTCKCRDELSPAATVVRRRQISETFSWLKSKNVRDAKGRRPSDPVGTPFAHACPLWFSASI